MAGLFDMEEMQKDYAKRKMEKEQQAMTRQAPVQQQQPMNMENNFDPDSIEFVLRKRKIQQMQEEMRLAQEQAAIEAKYAAQNQPEQGFFSGLFGN